jgi:4-amino-4-deoxy-L-arabinose transferase-like glycosyltransferase
MVVIGRYIRSGNLNWFFLFGVIAGLGALSKYTMVLLPLSILIWSILEKRHRKLLYHWKVYASAILAFLILLPNLYWNYQNQWVTFDFLLGKGLTGNSFNFNALLFFAAQLFVFSFVYSCFFWGGLLRKRIRLSTLFPANPEEREKGSFLFICGLFPVLFFTLSSVPGEYTDPSWLDTAYFGIFLLLAKFIDIELSQGKIRKTVTLYLAAFLFNVVLISILLSQIYFNIFNLTERQMTLFSVIGWPETASQIEEIFRQQGVQLPEYVVSREYQVASGLSLYLENHPLPHSLEKPRRNQWSPVNDVLKKGAVLVCPPDDCEGDLEDAKAVFNRSLRLVGESFVNHRKGKIRELRIYYLPGS